ncbi:vegetative cell wall protein gp1-like [Eutrema salsugineum]|uniref:vegetative cell wall protein gp1-like n=1 Tax=Eutrema salsugineum TaxID=72664 RepID=UPI000CED37F1|nr:vegetative cell wall protein gp1-like [Eutrema salsugineum]
MVLRRMFLKPSLNRRNTDEDHTSANPRIGSRSEVRDYLDMAPRANRFHYRQMVDPDGMAPSTSATGSVIPESSGTQRTVSQPVIVPQPAPPPPPPAEPAAPAPAEPAAPAPAEPAAPIQPIPKTGIEKLPHTDVWRRPSKRRSSFASTTPFLTGSGSGRSTVEENGGQLPPMTKVFAGTHKKRNGEFTDPRAEDIYNAACAAIEERQTQLTQQARPTSPGGCP